MVLEARALIARMLAASLAPVSRRPAARRWLAGAPDNEADVHEEEEVLQRSCVVYLLWVGAGFSARPLGLRPFAFPAGSSGITGKGSRNS